MKWNLFIWEMKLQNDNLKQLIEAIIFVSSVPVTVKELKHYFKNYEAKELIKALEEIASDFETSDRGFELLEISNGYQFRSKAEFAEDIINFNKEIKNPDWARHHLKHWQLLPINNLLRG